MSVLLHGGIVGSDAESDATARGSSPQTSEGTVVNDDLMPSAWSIRDSDDQFTSDEGSDSHSSTDSDQEDGTYESFLQSPEVLWQDRDPPPEKALSLACNSM